MKSHHPCPSCGARTLEWCQLIRQDKGLLTCENCRCTSKVTADGVEADTEEKAIELLKEAVKKESEL